MEHKCERSKGVTITWVDNHWEAVNAIDGGIAGFGFCPYCGLKLEPPKPVFDAKTYAEYETIMNEACRAHMWRELERLERLILGEDEMIAVSRKMLHSWISGIDKVQRHIARETVGQTCARLVKVTRSIAAAMYD